MRKIILLIVMTKVKACSEIALKRWNGIAKQPSRISQLLNLILAPLTILAKV